MTLKRWQKYGYNIYYVRDIRTYDAWQMWEKNIHSLYIIIQYRI